MNRNAALYVRSSKDRRDVSIDAQRRELRKLAKDKGLVIVAEYTDAVESAKDEYRPGFQHLLLDLKSRHRAWSCLLVADTSRLSRRRHFATVFKHEAKKRGIQILYAKLPETDPLADMVVVGVMEIFDELHSLMSKQKGLAGMAENVRQGFRAGGRAPRGYRLRKIETGATREGESITKSVLAPNDEARRVARYLKGIAAGQSRTALAKELGIRWRATTLIGMEWNALTYAGHTVWNVHNEFVRGHGYKGGVKRRPRAEWVIQRDTHDPLISDQEADTILERLTSSKHARGRRTPATYVLSGLLKSPDGATWHGDGYNYYRIKGQRGILKDLVEDAVVRQVFCDVQSPEFVKTLTAAARQYYAAHNQDPAGPLRSALSDLTNRISRLMDLAAELENPAPALRNIDTLERRRSQLIEEIERLDREYVAATALQKITERDVQTLLQAVAEDLQVMDRQALNDMLTSIIDRVELSPDSLACQIHYRIGLTRREALASPRGFIPYTSSLVVPFSVAA